MGIHLLRMGIHLLQMDMDFYEEYKWIFPSARRLFHGSPEVTCEHAAIPRILGSVPQVFVSALVPQHVY